MAIGSRFNHSGKSWSQVGLGNLLQRILSPDGREEDTLTTWTEDHLSDVSADSVSERLHEWLMRKHSGSGVPPLATA